MSRFRLNTGKVLENFDDYTNVKSNCDETVYNIYRNLNYIESAWRDNNTPSFYSTILKDKDKISDYFDYMDNLYNQMRIFAENINSICFSYGSSRNSVDLKFDDSKINLANTYLNNSIWYLNQALSYINYYDFSNFSQLWRIYDLRNDVISIRNYARGLINDAIKFSNEIKNEIKNSENKIKHIEPVDLNLKTMSYSFNVVDNYHEFEFEKPSTNVNVDNIISPEIKESDDINLSQTISMPNQVDENLNANVDSLKPKDFEIISVNNINQYKSNDENDELELKETKINPVNNTDHYVNKDNSQNETLNYDLSGNNFVYHAAKSESDVEKSTGLFDIKKMYSSMAKSETNDMMLEDKQMDIGTISSKESSNTPGGSLEAQQMNMQEIESKESAQISSSVPLESFKPNFETISSKESSNTPGGSLETQQMNMQEIESRELAQTPSSVPLESFKPNFETISSRESSNILGGSLETQQMNMQEIGTKEFS